MGYFSNGSEGENFQSKFCARCVHDMNQNCPIWLLHLMWNYDAIGKTPDETKAAALETLMPRSKDGLSNKCNMFHAITDSDKVEVAISGELERLGAWNAGKPKVTV